MNTPEFDFTAEQPNRLFEKWWAEQAEYRHRQTGISEARAIWLCSWRAYGEACRAATPAPEGMRLVPVEPTEEMLDKGAMEIAMNMQRVMTAERKAEHVYRAMLAASPVPPAPATGEQEREAFEKWFSGDGKWPKGIERDKSGYLLMTAATAWDVWQARAALSAPQAAPATGSVLTDESERERFEIWWSEVYMSGLDGKPEWDESRNCYVYVGAHHAWKGFQARAILAAKGETS